MNHTSGGEYGLYLVLISVHGLIRGHDLELGRDADTGGQTLYVVELARALAKLPEVARVDLITRQVFDRKIADDYAEPEERIADKAHIVRVPAGPRRYLRKEALWNHLDTFTDNVARYLRSRERLPDAVHSHYADAGYVGVRLTGQLDVPLIYTGHSLGRVKRQRLQEKGYDDKKIEERYNIGRRIEAEEEALYTAARVIASTRQEVEEQYALYDYYQPDSMTVIPPGIDLERFHPPRGQPDSPPIQDELKRFLTDPGKPIILALARADERKNFATLVKAYGESERLQQVANLTLIAGNRDRIRDLDRGARNVLTELLTLIDDYDLYGRVAYPKHHSTEDIPDLYRLAAHSGGVFVNPALTEPFGLTLIEAAASGLPMVATRDGGPYEIEAHCHNGILIDPLDSEAITEALLAILTDRKRWKRYSESGIKGAVRNYTWSGHAQSYVDMVKKIIGGRRRRAKMGEVRRPLVQVDRALVSDIDDTLLGDGASLDELVRLLSERRETVAFGVATGRRIDSALQVLEEWSVPVPDVLITAVGTEIYYGPDAELDEGWARHIEYRWDPDSLHRFFMRLPGLKLQEQSEQRRFKISWFIDPDTAPDEEEIVRRLRQEDLQAHIVFSHEHYLDVVPVRASKGAALRWFADQWNIPLEKILVAGDSGNDEDMLRGRTLGVVVGNHHPELSRLADFESIYFAEGHHARGILEGIEYYDFFGKCRMSEGEAA